MIIWACLCAGDILLRREGAEGAFSLPVGDEPPVPLQPWNIVTTLEHDDDVVKVVRLNSPVIDVEGLQMMNLRSSYDVLDYESYTLAGKAAELIYWDQNTKYCGCCGGEMRFHTEISKRCRECGKEVWPQLATAIIVRVKRPTSDSLREGGSEILLVHATNFRGDFYGLVAGFVETGETLEDCVRREVREETGIEVTNIRYFASQPWPYPCGLMVGFTADYAGGELCLQRSELSAGGWFTKDNLPKIPGRVSLARRLIDDWLKKG